MFEFASARWPNKHSPLHCLSRVESVTTRPGEGEPVFPVPVKCLTGYQELKSIVGQNPDIFDWTICDTAHT